MAWTVAGGQGTAFQLDALSATAALFTVCTMLYDYEKCGGNDVPLFFESATVCENQLLSTAFRATNVNSCQTG